MDSKEKENINEEELKAQAVPEENGEEATEKEEVTLTEEEKLEKEMQLGQETASVQETEQGHDAQTELEVTEGTEQNKPEGGIKEEK